MLTTLAFLATLASGPVETPVTLPSEPAPLQGTMLAPEGETRAVAVIIAGSGPTDRDGNSPLGVNAATYRLLAEGLAEQGIATVRYDKRGIAGSAAAATAEADLRFGQMADDAAGWARLAAATTGRECAWLIGHSEGALVAEVAARNAEGICGLVLLAGAGRPAGVVIREQLASVPEPLKTEAFAALSELEAGRTTRGPARTGGAVPGLGPALSHFLAAAGPGGVAGHLSGAGADRPGHHRPPDSGWPMPRPWPPQGPTRRWSGGTASITCSRSRPPTAPPTSRPMPTPPCRWPRAWWRRCATSSWATETRLHRRVTGGGYRGGMIRIMLAALVLFAGSPVLAQSAPAIVHPPGPAVPMVIAHRGASGERPEHTRAAYDLAIDQGADVIEPDLVMSQRRCPGRPPRERDQRDHRRRQRGRSSPIGARPARSTAARSIGWFTEDFTLAELKTLRARERLPQLRPGNSAFDGTEPILTFEEVIDIARAGSAERAGRSASPRSLNIQPISPVGAWR